MVAYPLVLQPILIKKPWGGSRIPALFNPCVLEPVGEAWLFSTLPGNSNFILNGKNQGSTLDKVLASWKINTSILAKLLDSAQPLSVQVHPSDELARKLENSPHGKTEAWYIVESDHSSRVFHGLKQTKDKIASIDFRNIHSILNSFPVTPGDIIPIPAGTVHSTDGNLLWLEIQQSSDITYRIYDFGRTDRELHLEKAMEAISEDKCQAPIRGGFWECDKFGMEETLYKNGMQWESSYSVLIPFSNSILKYEDQSVEVLPYQAIFVPKTAEYHIECDQKLRLLRFFEN